MNIISLFLERVTFIGVSLEFQEYYKQKLNFLKKLTGFSRLLLTFNICTSILFLYYI